MEATHDADDPTVLAAQMRASWISAPGADGPGSWLLRRDIDLVPLLASRDGLGEARIGWARLLVASTGDVTAYVDDREVCAVRALGPAAAAGAVEDVTELLLPGGARADHVSLALIHVDDRAGRPAVEGGPAVLAALVLDVERGAPGPGTATETLVVGSDGAWWTAPGPIAFAPREDPALRMLELHEAPASGSGLGPRDDLRWTAFGAMHTDAERTWTPAVDRGRHPSLVHPPIVIAPPLVEEYEVEIRDHVMAPGGVQCLDLGETVCIRPLLALPDGARRPVTLWAGPVPGTPPRGGDVRIDTRGQAAVLEAHGTMTGRWLHVHGAPDLDTEGVELPVRTGVLPRPLGVDLSDERVSLLLSDALASLHARCQEQYRGEAGPPLLAQIARTARAALLVGADTWRSERALDAFLATARSVDVGMVVDAIAPDGPRADLDEHTYALPAWVADQAAAGAPPRRAARVIAGIWERLAARVEQGPSPAERMTTAAAALEAIEALGRLARRGGSDTEPFALAARSLREQARETLRAGRASGGRGTWLEARGDAASTPRATAMAVLSGLVDADDLPFALLALRPVLEEGHAADPEGLVRAALLRAGAGREVVDAHREGDDVPPVVLTELVGAVSGMTVDGDRVHVRTPSLPLEAIDLDLPHPRGDIEIRWDCEEGEVVVPEGMHVLVHADGASAPVWYNSGTTAVRRPAPQL